MGKNSKFYRRQKTNSLIEGFSRKKNILPILCITIFSLFLCVNLTPLVSGTAWPSSLDDVKAVWEFDDDSDSVAGHYNITETFAITTGNAGLFGNSYTLDSLNSAILFNKSMYNLSVKNFTVVFWIKKNASWVDDEYLWWYADVGDSNPEYYLKYELTGMTGLKAQSPAGTMQCTLTPTPNVWTMYALQGSDDGSGNWSLWINGTVCNSTTVTMSTENIPTNHSIGEMENPGQAMNGSVDNYMWWDRFLTPSEVVSLYNNGVGLEYGATDTNITYPRSPSDNFNSVDLNVTIICNATSDDGVQNITLHIDDVVNATTDIGNETNSTASFNLNFQVGKHSWYCDATSGSNTLIDTNETRNFTVGIIENTNTFNSTTSEGATETIVLNITYNSSTYTNLQGTLVYNNTRYTGTKTTVGKDTLLSKTIIVDDLTGAASLDFYWELSFNDGVNTVLFNTTSQSQSASTIAVDDCSTYTELILNLTMKNEETEAAINESTYNTTVYVDLDIRAIGSSTSLLNFSLNYTKDFNPQVCIDDLNVTYELDAEIRYDADDYAAEYYHIQNSTLSNTTAPFNIILFDLADTSAQQFLITFKDENFVPLGDALIEIQRKYTDKGIFQTVEIPKTDENGQAVASLQLEGALYNIVVTKYGATIATFENVAVYCEDSAIGDCKINLNALGSAGDFSDWDELGDITYTMTFDEDNRRITAIFTSTDGSSKTVLLNATKFDRFGNITVCSDSISTASGTLTCNIPASYGNVTVIAELSVNGEIITRRTYSILPDPNDIFGRSAGGVMMLMLMLTLPLMFISSPIGVIIGIFMGLVFGSLLMLITTNKILGASSIIIWAVIAGGIIIWKVSRRSS